jgi:hypothetical protein
MRHLELRLPALALAALAMSQVALATGNNRSWVSTAGADNNACNLAFPCKTLQAALNATNGGGEVDVLNPGEYGPVNITRSVTIDGGNLAYIQGPAGAGTVSVAAGASDVVVIRNLSIISAYPTPSTCGICWSGGSALYVENVSIFGVTRGIMAIGSANASGDSLTVSNVAIRHVSSAGVAIQPPSGTSMNAVLDRVAIDAVTAGAGISLFSGRAVLIRSSITHIYTSALDVESAGQMDADDSTLAFAARSILVVGTGSSVRLAGNNIHDNQSAMAASGGGQILSFGNNRFSGNGADGVPTGTIALK